MLVAADTQHIISVHEGGAAFPPLDDPAVLQGDLDEGLVDVLGVEDEGLGAHLQPALLLFLVEGLAGRIARDQNRAKILEVDLAGIQ